MENLDTFQCGEKSIPGLRSRTNQIMLPLMGVADHMQESQQTLYRADLLSYCETLENQARQDRKDTIEAKLLKAYVELCSIGAPTCSELVIQVREAKGDNDPTMQRWLTPKFVGRTMRGLGAEAAHSNKGTVITFDAKRLSGLCTRFGIVITGPESLPPSVKM